MTTKLSSKQSEDSKVEINLKLPLVFTFASDDFDFVEIRVLNCVTLLKIKYLILSFLKNQFFI